MFFDLEVMLSLTYFVKKLIFIWTLKTMLLLLTQVWFGLFLCGVYSKKNKFIVIMVYNYGGYFQSNGLIGVFIHWHMNFRRCLAKFQFVTWCPYSRIGTSNYQNETELLIIIFLLSLKYLQKKPLTNYSMSVVLYIIP